MPADRRPSYEELAAENAQLRGVVDEMRAEVAELRRQLGQNSGNSSQPPSSDGLAKPAPKSRRGKSKRKPGGQAGHPGATLEQVSDPDEVLRHEPGACGGCGSGLAGAPTTGMQRRQVFDLPPMRVRVAEHQLVQRRCGCGITTCADAPAGVDAPVSYGPRITAIVLYLYVGQFLSKARTAQALAELFGTPVSEGTISAMTGAAAEGLDEFTGVVRERIAGAEVAGFDETGLRVGGSLHWVHCARTDRYTLITCHRRRGRAGIDDAAVLPGFAGVAVHDAWAPYDVYVDPAHQLCCAHVLRELAGVTDTKPDGEWSWAEQAADALVALQQLVAEAIAVDAEALDPEALQTQRRLFRSAARIGATETATRSTKLMKRHNALARRLINREADYLRFLQDWRIPPDNNGSERDIRMVKLRQKVSGGLRTLTGAKQFCTIRSYLSTAAKHGRTGFDALVTLAEGQPWIPA